MCITGVAHSTANHNMLASLQRAFVLQEIQSSVCARLKMSLLCKTSWIYLLGAAARQGNFAGSKQSALTNSCMQSCLHGLPFFSFLFFNKLWSSIISQPSSPVYTVDNSSINKIYIIKPTHSTIVPTVSMSTQLLKHCSQSMNGSQICRL